jgi:hypothetical protein
MLAKPVVPAIEHFLSIFRTAIHAFASIKASPLGVFICEGIVYALRMKRRQKDSREQCPVSGFPGLAAVRKRRWMRAQGKEPTDLPGITV